MYVCILVYIYIHTYIQCRNSSLDLYRKLFAFYIQSKVYINCICKDVCIFFLKISPYINVILCNLRCITFMFIYTPLYYICTYACICTCQPILILSMGICQICTVLHKFRRFNIKIV